MYLFCPLGCVDGITVARDNFSDRPHNSKSPFKAENTLEEYLSSFPDEEHYDRAMEYMYHRLVVAEYKVKEVVAFIFLHTKTVSHLFAELIIYHYSDFSLVGSNCFD